MMALDTLHGLIALSNIIGNDLTVMGSNSAKTTVSGVLDHLNSLALPMAVLFDYPEVFICEGLEFAINEANGDVSTIRADSDSVSTTLELHVQ